MHISAYYSVEWIAALNKTLNASVPIVSLKMVSACARARMYLRRTMRRCDLQQRAGKVQVQCKTIIKEQRDRLLSPWPPVSSSACWIKSLKKNKFLQMSSTAPWFLKATSSQYNQPLKTKFLIHLVTSAAGVIKCDEWITGQNVNAILVLNQ